MTPRLKIYAALYLGFLALVVAGCAYAAARLGQPWRYGAFAGFVLVWFANGTFAYVYRSRRLRAEGKQAPTYASYMLSPGRGPVPRSLRVVVGLVAMGFGAILALSGGGLMSILIVRGLMLPADLVLLALLAIPLVLGALLAYIGFRFVFGKDDETLFRTAVSRQDT